MNAEEDQLEEGSSSGSAVGALQPFQCLVCFKRFTRHENLKRHSAIHRSSESNVVCHFCPATFARKDLRRRHENKKHQDELAKQSAQEQALPKSDTVEPPNRIFPFDYTTNAPPIIPQVSPSLPITSTGDASRSSSITVNGNTGMSSLADLFNTPDVLSTSWVSQGSLDTGIDFSFPSNVSPSQSIQSPPGTGADFLSATVIEEGVKLYFDKVGPFFPFLHRATFDIKKAPQTLILGMLSVSLQYGVDPMEGKRVATLIQAHVLLMIHSILCAGGTETRHGLHYLLNRSVELSRAGGLMDPLPSQSPTTDLESLWRSFIRRETHKRTAYVVYLIDALCYQIFSRPRLVSHLEIKHVLPSCEQEWQAPTAGAWAHATLTSSKETHKYIEAVRAALRPDPSSQLKAFGPFAVMLVMLFIMSSVREMSGWATMTLKLSSDRFEIMHAALLALEPAIHSGTDPHSIALTATWNMMMLELLLWSAPHTLGIVETSLDAALAAATSLAASKPIVLAPQIAEALDPHLTWFLQYLAGPADPDKEAPWVTIYAFRAALIAWQLARDGAYDLARIGVADLQGMIYWMKTVFERRTRWGTGRLVVRSLDELLSHS